MRESRWQLLVSVILLFLLLHILHQPIASFIVDRVDQLITNDTTSLQLALFSERLLYLLLFIGAGTLWLALFHRLQPWSRAERRLELERRRKNLRQSWPRLATIPLPLPLIGGVLLLSLLAIGLTLLLPSKSSTPLVAQFEVLPLTTALLLVLVTPPLEELFYRQGLLGALGREFGFAAAVVVQAILFTLAHSLAAAWVIFPAALLFGFLFWRWGVLCSTVAHALYNLTLLTYGTITTSIL